MEDGYWEVSCPRTLGFFARLRGKSEDAELQNVVNALDEILQDEETITDVKWYGDYLDLTDGYVREAGVKRLSIVGKYLYKLAMPLCVGGWVLMLIGGIRSGKESLLLRIGTIMFLFPIVSYFGFLGINVLWGLIDDIKKSYRKGLKKKWLRWFFVLTIIAMFVVPVLLGLLRVPSADKVMPTILKYVFRFAVLLLFCGMLFCLPWGVLYDVKKQKERKKKIFIVVGLMFILFGMTGFFSGGFSALGMLKWIPENVEFPLAHVAGIDVNREGNLFVASGFYSRIQVYNPNGEFVRGWFLDDTGGGHLKIRISNENEVEIAVVRGRKIDVFDENGGLLETKKYGKGSDFFDSFEQKGKYLSDEPTGLQYDVEGWAFPRIIQTGPDGKKKIGKNAFYLFPFQGAFQGWVMAVVGMLLIARAEKKKKKKRY
jgi:hypothetical protein